MKKLILLMAVLFSSQINFAQIVINELDCDNPSFDDTEFIELKTASPNFAMDGYVLVLFNGSTGGGDSSYYALDLDGMVSDDNGLFLLGSTTMMPFPQAIIPSNIIQNGADAVAIYQGNGFDFPAQTLANTTNLIDALVYDTNDPDDTNLLSLLGETQQISEGSAGNSNSIQLNNDGTTYTVTTPTPRQLNDGSGVIYNQITISIDQEQYTEGETFNITFSAQANVSQDATFSFTLNNFGFNTSDFTGNTTVTIPAGQNSVSTTITLTDDTFDEGDEEPIIKFSNLQSPNIAFNNFVKFRVVDNDFTVANFGTPTNPTFGNVTSTQPPGYYDTLNGLADAALKQAIQDIVADPATVRAQTYTDVIDILKQADQNPLNSNEVWLVYLEQGKPKLDFQNTGSNVGKWNREHTFPKSRGGFYEIEADEDADGIDVFWTTKADSIRHGYSDAHALRAADGPENSIRSNQNYGEYNGPTGNLGSFKGDVARSVLFLELRYNGLQVVNGFPTTSNPANGLLGDLATLLDWHRNDLPDDFEMNRNNIVYNWQFNRNPLIDMPDLVEYIWGNNAGDTWNNSLNTQDFSSQSLKIYPNPVKDKLFIIGNKSNYTINIYSSEGRKIESTVINNNNFINLNLPSGFYFAEISSEGKTTVKKFIVK